MTDYPPQMPGNVKIHLERGKGSIVIDGYPIDQFVTGMQIRFHVRDLKPVLMLDLDPSAIDLTGNGFEMNGEFRDFLMQHGWRPPQ